VTTVNASLGDSSIKSATFLNTHTDFSTKGQLGVFTDEATIAGLERKMAKRANAKTVEVNASHVAYMSHPKETAKLIEQAATSATVKQ